MATPQEHEVEINYDPATKTVTVNPELLPQPPNKAHRNDKITWRCNQSDNWAVVFGPDSPFEEQVIGKGLSIPGREGPTQSSTMVTAKRPGDFHKHKYVAIVWTGTELVACDPEVDVDEE